MAVKQGLGTDSLRPEGVIYYAKQPAWGLMVCFGGYNQFGSKIERFFGPVNRHVELKITAGFLIPIFG